MEVSKASQPRILFVDAYDSFSNNIISFLQSQLHVDVIKIKIDAEIQSLPSYLNSFAAVVVGPGPGDPRNPEDVGLIGDIWDLAERDIIPVLGICLGFQSLVQAFGGHVRRLPCPRHGIETKITSNRSSMFKGLPEFRAVQYHSLHASMEEHACLDTECEPRWDAHGSCPDLVPLAWDLTQMTSVEAGQQSSVNPHSILMAVRHVTKPYYGIQFHPESICSEEDARQVVINWWEISRTWLQAYRPQKIGLGPDIKSLSSGRVPAGVEESSAYCSSVSSTPKSSRASSPSSASTNSSACIGISGQEQPQLLCESIPLGTLDVPQICETLQIQEHEMVLLDSEMRRMPELGVHSVIGPVDSDTTRIQYSTGADHVELIQGGSISSIGLEPYQGKIMTFLKSFLRDVSIEAPDVESPFLGGLVGYLTYEACLETIGIREQARRGRPDVCFAFIKRSLAINHLKRVVHIQSLLPDDEEWVLRVKSMLEMSRNQSLEELSRTPLAPSLSPQSVDLPVQDEYERKIRACKKQIAAGNSYELCLTDQTVIRTQRWRQSSWLRYLRMRKINPAPFAAYLRLGSLTLLSTSPERFMGWSRPRLHHEPLDELHRRETISTCQFRPIKGTVKKSQVRTDGTLRTISHDEATTILSTNKERAENLMIVDLIRHDLHGVVGHGNVTVKTLISVEEYESVFQLVSVIEGTIRQPYRPFPLHHTIHDPLHSKNLSGIDVLAASLPPGSMTGAPKRRSCELLREIEEHQPRSVYSGVLGYMCVAGGGDLSVVIRSAFKWDHGGGDGEDGRETEEWRIGAGGAVTGLSTEDGEWEEMLVKLKATLGTFQKENQG